MDLAAELRTAQQALAAAEQRLTQARQDEKTASRAYDQRRRYAPGGLQTNRARTAWALALTEWVTALVDREKTRDLVKAERHQVDENAMVALMSTEHPYEPTEERR
jgi:multidrug efflux pump subunit AcrA (membrane-fusion protein)